MSLKIKQSTFPPASISHPSVLQDGLYLSLQRGVDWFAEMVGMPPGRKYNSVLFGGMEFKQLKQNLHCFQVICNVVRNDEEIDKKYKTYREHKRFSTLHSLRFSASDQMKP